MVRLRDVRRKVPVSVRLDPQVLDWLRGKGEGHLTRINDILTNLMEAERRMARADRGISGYKGGMWGTQFHSISTQAPTEHAPARSPGTWAHLLCQIPLWALARNKHYSTPDLQLIPCIAIN